MIRSQSTNPDFNQPLPDEFKDIIVKLRRAHEHIETFNSAIKDFWKSEKRYDGAPERDRKEQTDLPSYPR